MKSHIIRQTETLRNAFRQLNLLSGDEMTLFVVDDLTNMRVVGTLTNGDIRRALLDGASLDSALSAAMHTDFRRLYDNADDQVDNIRNIRRLAINMVPVVDSEGRLVDIARLDGQRTRLPLSAILMAGGKGERLRPLTLDTPKPLLEIDGKAIIDYNIEALLRAGITDITVATGYLADKIHSHFAQPFDGVRIKCVTETQPLGTIGAVSLVRRPDKGATLVMNSDLLTTVSFEDAYIKHRDSRADITICVIPYQLSVPYAILTTDGDSVTGLDEKPSYSHYANAGIYIFNNAILNTVVQGQHIDATDLIRQTIDAGGRVVYHVINGTWIDVGSHTDFAHARDLMRHHRNLTNNS